MSSRSQAHAALGRAVRDLRGVRGISQEDLAHRSGMHRTYLGGIERGERNVSYTNLKRLARALDVPASHLLQRAEAHENSGSRG
ncbi:MAG TPA: helix-turn-helix transcriptional regulator [Solirubrobacteraceae bacterium]